MSKLKLMKYYPDYCVTRDKIRVKYFGVLLTVDKSMEYIATNKSGHIFGFMDHEKPVIIGNQDIWCSPRNRCELIGEVILEDIDWKDTLVFVSDIEIPELDLVYRNVPEKSINIVYYGIFLSVDERYKYIAINSSGEIFIYLEKPQETGTGMCSGYWAVKNGIPPHATRCVGKVYLKGIKWEDTLMEISSLTY